jgi:hypothetical protein
MLKHFNLDAALFLRVLGSFVLISLVSCIPHSVNQKTSIVTQSFVQKTPIVTQTFVHKTSGGAEVEVLRFRNTSIPEITNFADIIVTGKLKPIDKFFNGSRSPGERSKPDTDLFSIGHIYEIKVDSYLKGEGPDTLYLVIHEGFITPDENVTPSSEDMRIIRKEKEGKDWKPLKLNSTYLLFLDRFDDDSYEIDSIPVENLFVGSTNPWMFDCQDTQQVVPEEPNPSLDSGDLLLYFPPQPLESIIEQINQPYSTPTPWPTPLPTPTDVPYMGPE